MIIAFPWFLLVFEELDDKWPPSLIRLISDYNLGNDISVSKKLKFSFNFGNLLKLTRFCYTFMDMISFNVFFKYTILNFKNQIWLLIDIRFWKDLVLNYWPENHHHQQQTRRCKNVKLITDTMLNKNHNNQQTWN